MKKLQIHIISIFCFLTLIIFSSCENPLFINAVKLYEVTFSTNGGTTIDSCRTDCIKEMPYTTRSDYSFLGWHLKSDFSDKPVTFPLDINQDTTLYAQWQAQYSVVFETNGGDIIDSYKTGIIEYSPDITKKDFRFDGWYTTSDFSGKPITFPYTVTRPVTLYAKWTQVSFLVNFETNSGTSVSSYKTNQIPEAPVTTRTNFEFGGWYTTSDLSGEPISYPYKLTRNITLYAKWTPTYEVSFETYDGAEIASYRAITISIAPTTFKSGYSFIGWYTDPLFQNIAEFPYTPTTDTVFYAKWQQIYNVTFVTNGGTNVAAISTGYIENSPLSTKSNASLEGWYLDADFTPENKITFPYTVTGDITLYAKWKAEQCTITYYANGATSGEVPQSVSVDKGSIYTVLGNTGNLEKTGFAFTKWNTRADGVGQGYSAGSTLSVTGDVSLYAQWGKDYAAMIYVEGGSYYFGSPENAGRPKITLSSFQIAQYELTYELWFEVYSWAKDNGYNLTSANKGYATNDKFKNFVPATYISWNMACVWLNAYSEYKGFKPVYYRGGSIWRDDTNTNGYCIWNKNKNGFRLPTECEWEFAAGGGALSIHDNYKYSGSNKINDVAWYYDNSKSESNPVGSKNMNKLNIYDMSGNIAEWCFDTKETFGAGELTNPLHDSSSSYRICRGGDFYSSEQYNSIYNRESYDDDSRSYSSYNSRYGYNNVGTGMRIARNAE